MANCQLCNQDMLTAAGCDYAEVHIAGCWRARTRYGNEDEDWGADGGGRCHDCNTEPGHLHHPGCDVERCPACGLQFISCECSGGEQFRNRACTRAP